MPTLNDERAAEQEAVDRAAGAAPAPPFDLPMMVVAGLAVLVALAICGALWIAQAICIPIVFALLISYALDPVYQVLRRAHLPSGLAAALVLFVLLSGVAAIGFSLRGQAGAFIASLPDTAREVRAAVLSGVNGPSPVTQVQRAANEIQKASTESTTAPPAPPGVTRVQVEATPLTASDVIWKGTGSALVVSGQALVVVVLVFYFLISGEMFKRKLVRIIGTTISEKRITVEILNDIERHIARYLVTRALISAIVGTATWLAFWWLGMPQAGVWGFGAGLLNVIPYLGPIAIAASSAVVAFLHFGDGTHALIVGATASAIATIEGFAITPQLMGKAGRMNGAAVFIALSFWGFLWGLWGLLLAVPITMAIKVVCDHVEELSAVSELLSE
jgi:predicted PurR-regulated permease PerM